MKRYREAGPTFSEKVIELALAIPPGRVTTYGHLARAAHGGAMAAQSITSILGKAWEKGEHRIPWHRIVYADSRVWFDEAHKEERLRLYKKENIVLDEKGRIKNFGDVLFEFK